LAKSLTINNLNRLTKSAKVMIIREQKPYNTLILNMMDKLPNINKWRRMFLLETFIYFLSIRGRMNFLQLARYGKYKEQRYRQHLFNNTTKT
jgi:hypothetical protein